MACMSTNTHTNMAGRHQTHIPYTHTYHIHTHTNICVPSAHKSRNSSQVHSHSANGTHIHAYAYIHVGTHTTWKGRSIHTAARCSSHASVHPHGMHSRLSLQTVTGSLPCASTCRYKNAKNHVTLSTCTCLCVASFEAFVRAHGCRFRIVHGCK
jgi:hypothetical protein